jgi:hypothetical protein
MLKPMKRNKVLAIFANAFLIASSMQLMAAGPLDTSMQIEKEMDKAAQATQKQVDTLADQTLDMASDYQLTLQSIDATRAYNDSLRKYIASQEAEMRSLQTQMDGIDATERSVIPMMEDMIEALDQFIHLDTPFLLEEREARVERLREMMLRADVSNSEKYRKILEAYQVENDYGSSVSTYKDAIVDSGTGQEITVDFLRFGRVVLVYQTADERSRAYWDNASRSWVPLDDEYRLTIRNGIKMAQGQANLDLLTLPVSTPKPAR